MSPADEDPIQPPGETGANAGGLSRRGLIQSASGLAAALAWGRSLESPADALAGANVISVENQHAGDSSFPITTQTQGFGGFTGKSSYLVGEALDLKLIHFGSTASLNVSVYRLGYYGGHGARLVHGPVPVTVSDQGAASPDATFGRASNAAWSVTTTLSGATPVTGLYLVKLDSGSAQHHIPYVVRDDASPRDALVVLPTNTWQAYNAWPIPNGKSLYYFNSSTAATATATPRPSDSRVRATKVSYDRPFNHSSLNDWCLRNEFPLIYWLEQQGYDLGYADDPLMHSSPTQLIAPQTRVLIIAGHSEYWTKEMRDNVEAARDHGTSICCFSSNAGYWKVRYEDSNRTVVCFKTVEGTGDPVLDGAGSSGTVGVNDYAPGTTGAGGTDCRGPDGLGGTADDLPADATTTFRDPGYRSTDPDPNGDRPSVGRVGANRPENSLWGMLYVGDDDANFFPLTVPPSSTAPGEFGSHPAWRNTSVGPAGKPALGTNLLGWEWDAVPLGQYGVDESGANSLANTPFASHQPAGVRRLTETIPPTTGTTSYLLDPGRRRTNGPSLNPVPPNGRQVNSSIYTAPSGAQVFASGSMQWVWGLGIHYEQDFTHGPTDSRVADIQQATYNILFDMGLDPATPAGVRVYTRLAPGGPPGPGPAPGGGTPAPVPGPTKPLPAPRLLVLSHSLGLGPRDRVVVEVMAPLTDHGTVRGTITLTTAHPLRTSRHARPRRLVLGHAAYSVRPGTRTAVAVSISGATARLLRHARHLKVDVTATVHDASRHAGAAHARLALSAPKR